MALIDLQSDLSFYGRTAPGFKPNKDRTSTDFKYNDDLTVHTIAQGFNDLGDPVSFRRPIITGDSFQIDDASWSDRGNASRKMQLGIGSRFPISPTGKIHKFDTERTGFNPSLKYEDVFGNQSPESDNANSGLANTYTTNSPIDDMYNKFKVRDEVYDPYGYAKPPFILRGIQRDGSSDPQRFGIPGNPLSDLPRGGIVTAAERTLMDAIRLGKFLIRPKGIAFIATQFALQVMNPNVEGISGKAAKPAIHINSTKLFTPVNMLASALGGQFGLRFRRHGLLPSTQLDPTSDILPGSYGDVHAIRSALGITEKNNRLILLGKRYGAGSMTSAGAQYNPIEVGQGELPGGILSAPAGPKSVAGLGATIIRRYEDTSLIGQLSDTKLTRGGLGGLTYQEYIGKYYTFGRPYMSVKDQSDSGMTQEQIDTGDTFFGAVDSLRERTEAEDFKPLKDDINRAPNQDNLDVPPIQQYTTLAYGKLARDTSASGIRKSFAKSGNYETDDTIHGKYGIIQHDQFGIKPIKPSQPDPITNKAPFEDYGTDNDFIKFKFTPLRLTNTLKETEKPIIFRAYISSINDSFSPSWSEQQDQGRADAKIMLGGWSRSISVSFMVVSESESEQENIWKKLDELARLTYPIYASSGFTGTYVKTTIGDLYNGVPMYVTNLNYDWDTETPWELKAGKQVPYYTNVNMDLGWIGTQRPDHKTSAFSLNNITGGATA